MAKIRGRSGITARAVAATLPLLLVACGLFGGHYKIEATSPAAAGLKPKIPVRLGLVLSSELCNYTYTSYRQGAKRVYDLGEALCTNHRNLFSRLFESAVVAADDAGGGAADFDATVFPKVIDTSVLVRPGAPPSFEAAIVYECTIMDKQQRTVFLRTIKENKVYSGYGGGYGVVMQQAVDELFARLESELGGSPEIKTFARSLQ